MELKRVNDSTLRNWIDSQNREDCLILLCLILVNVVAWWQV